MDAVIFDMDGVISDTQRLHAQVESDVLARRGVALSPGEITRRFAGSTDHDLFDTVFGRALPPDELAEVVREKWAMIDAVAPGGIVAMEGAVELIRLLHARGVPLAVASGSPPSFIARVLAELGVADAFSAVASGDEVPRGKPAPDVFLLAAERLGVPPERCVVIEDAVAGMRGAIAAGMRVVALLEDPAAPHPAHSAVRSLREIVDAASLHLAIP